MKKLFHAGAIALVAAIGLLAGSAKASSILTCNGNSYTWPDQFQGYGYVTYWPLMQSDCIQNTANNVTAAQAAQTAAQAAAATATTSAATQASSTTSLTIGTGSQSLTVQTGKGFLAGMAVRIADQGAPTTNYMDGVVSSYNSGTGALVITVTAVGGSGTKTAWNVFLEGPPLQTSGSSLLAGNGSGGIQNVTVGTGLSYSSGTLSASNGLSFISTQAASGATSIAFTGLNSTVNTYLMQCNGLVIGGTAQSKIYVQFGEGATPTWESSSYNWAGTLYDAGATARNAGVTGDSGVSMTGAGTTNGGTTDGFTSTVVFSGIASTTRYKPIHINSTFVNNASANYTTADEGGTYVGDANAVTAVRIITHNGNAITGGQCSLYSLFN